jgi:hypothetical protein
MATRKKPPDPPVSAPFPSFEGPADPCRAFLLVSDLDTYSVIPAQLSASEAPSRDPDISRAKRDTQNLMPTATAGLILGSLAFAQMRWIPDRQLAPLALSGMTAK